MAVTIDLPAEEMRFLAEHLKRYVASLDDELVHSDSREIQRQLACDVDRLRRIQKQLSTSIA